MPLGQPRSCIRTTNGTGNATFADNSSQVGAVNMNGIELTNGSGQNIPTNCPTELVCRSQMLTVWRRLHIEVDSMGASQGNFVLGNIASPSITVSRNQTVTLDVNTTNPLEVNRFEDGRMTIGTRSFEISSNTDRTVSAIFRGPGSVFSIQNGVLLTLYDDDDFNYPFNDTNNQSTLNGDTGEDIPGPDDFTLNGTALLTHGSDTENTNVFAPAYVRPFYDIVADTRDDCLFQANTASIDAADLRSLFTPCWDSSNTNEDPEFWSVLIFGAYQSTINSDNDSSTELGCDGLPAFHCVSLGVVDEITGKFYLDHTGEGSGALIFTELMRAHERPAGYNPAPTSLTSMAVTVAHETAHLFSCRHGDGGIMGINILGSPVSNQYSLGMIYRIRGLMHP